MPAPSGLHPLLHVARRLRPSALGNLQDVGIFDHAPQRRDDLRPLRQQRRQRPPARQLQSSRDRKAGETVQFDASASKDLDGSIVKYEWDLDGNGSYETDTGTTPSASRSYAGAASINVGLRVTDNAGNTGSAARTLTVEEQRRLRRAPAPTTSNAVLGTAGLVDYWRPERELRLGLRRQRRHQPGQHARRPDARSTRRRARRRQHGRALRRRRRLRRRRPAARRQERDHGRVLDEVERLQQRRPPGDEYTPNYNDNPGGFVVDPNSSYGNFAVGLGQGLLAQPLPLRPPGAGAWHHYAFVLDTRTGAPKGRALRGRQSRRLQQGRDGTGAPPFANATLT